jgi:glycosyltransferase involved in cell wall biosynthesis
MSLRIALVTPRHAPYIGGVETHVSRLASALTAKGHQVEVFTQRTDPDTADTEEADGVLIRRFDGWLTSTAYPVPPRLWRALMRERRRFDVIHAHAYHGLASAVGRFARGERRPLVLTPHYHATGHTRIGRLLHPIYRPIGRYLVSAADRVICVSSAESSLVSRDFGPDVAARTVTIPNGVDLDEIRAAEPWPDAGRSVLCVGRLAGYKNVDLVIRAAQAFPEDLPLNIVGAGADRAELEELARTLGIDHRVHFLGRLPDEELRRWYRTATVFVAMSSFEAFGIGLLEALAAGARIVASDIPAHQEVAALAGNSGISFEAPDVDSERLAETILEAVAAGRFSADGSAADSIPTWLEVASRTEQVYAEAVAASNS